MYIRERFLQRRGIDEERWAHLDEDLDESDDLWLAQFFGRR